ncbi:DUF1003 domain-containing protein [Micrococcus luteus]|uniref:DUF1003 domain-containing protein n=2 Tax=Micrococcaceae TaxID=1268 RepID=UPI000D5054DC|nr:MULTISPECIES: DUF1003 domain-containing protein [Micrococcus]AWD23759.1 DUF1003 domain-containing protein [Micrococcus luteus]MCK1800624.1 DUF1003 domain-containing protein [Micrococcus sp. XM4230B]MCK1812432.1 DUF1003 domain-containing protein [Micrococcus sp. XM4230A]MCT2324975.1 DUF1003 domain-containing protein [Micrococcus luteus]MCV7458481.1 DUF1003 domain-containing protein [Micrococcus luteus]
MTQTARDLRPGRGTGLDTPLSASGRRVPRLAPNPDAFGEATEGIARFMGTPQFLVWMTLFCAAWLGWNTFGPMAWRFDSAELGFTALTLMLSLQASYAAPLLLLAQNRQDDRDKVALREDRDRAERNLADTEFLTREIAGLRLAVQEVATRDFVRGELRGVQDDLRDDLREALRAELREEIREEIREELRAGLPGAEAQPRKNKKTKGRGRDARRGDAGAEPTTTTLATLAAQEAQEAREAGGSGPVTGPAGGAGPVDGGGR